MSQQSNHQQTSVPDLSPTIGSQPSSITEDMWDTFEWEAEQEKEQEWSEEEQCAQGTPTESQMPTDSQIDSIMNWRPPFATSRDHVPAPHRKILMYHPALGCRECRHRVMINVEGGVQTYKTTTYPCDAHKA